MGRSAPWRSCSTSQAHWRHQRQALHMPYNSKEAPADNLEPAEGKHHRVLPSVVDSNSCACGGNKGLSASTVILAGSFVGDLTPLLLPAPEPEALLAIGFVLLLQESSSSLQRCASSRWRSLRFEWPWVMAMAMVVCNGDNTCLV